MQFKKYDWDDVNPAPRAKARGFGERFLNIALHPRSKERGFTGGGVNIEHIEKHKVTFQEVEEACFNEPLIMRTAKGRYAVYGRSDSGRYLFIVAIPRIKDTARIISARDMTDSERRLYNRKRG